MSRATEVANGCDIPHLTVSSHGDDCPFEHPPPLCPTHYVRRGVTDPWWDEDDYEVRLVASLDDCVACTHCDDLVDACPSCQHDTEFTWSRCELCGGLAGEHTTVAQIFPPLYDGYAVEVLPHSPVHTRWHNKTGTVLRRVHDDVYVISLDRKEIAFKRSELWTEPFYYAACPDCVIYIANGDLPDDEEN